MLPPTCSSQLTDCFLFNKWGGKTESFITPERLTILILQWPLIIKLYWQSLGPNQRTRTKPQNRLIKTEWD